MSLKRVLTILLVCAFLSSLGIHQSLVENVHGYSNQNGWVYQFGTWYYYMNGTMASNNWYNIGGKYYYFNYNGEMASDEIVDGWYVTKSGHWLVGNWYRNEYGWWYGNGGSYARNGLVRINGTYYYFDNYGYMRTGWQWDGSDWYYMNSSGAMLRNTWLSHGGRWYFVNSDGTMRTGWLNSGGRWYYLNSYGALETGWIKSGGRWYYTNSSGAMQTGWLNTGGRWYFLNSSGSMETGWLKSGGRWYWMNSSGAMLQNTWSQIGGTWYYFESDGSMASNKWIGNYFVNSSGAWVQSSNSQSYSSGNEGWSTRNGRRVYVTKYGLAKGFKDINGYRYYFDSNGYLASSVGIDISSHNDVYDFNQVKKSGVDYVIVRSSCTGYGAEGRKFLDRKYDDFMRRAKNAGLKVGIYHFSQAITEDEAREEARMAINQARKYSLDLPIFMDMEVVWRDGNGYTGRTVSTGRDQMTKVAHAFLSEVRNAGYTAGFYSNPSELSTRVHDAQIVYNYPLWLAQYYYKPTYRGQYKYWQYSSKGSVPGIRGNVDMNVMFDNFQ